MSFKLHIFTHDQDNVQIPSIVSIIVYNMYLEASEMCVWGVTTSLKVLKQVDQLASKTLNLYHTL